MGRAREVLAELRPVASRAWVFQRMEARELEVASLLSFLALGIVEFEESHQIANSGCQQTLLIFVYSSRYRYEHRSI